MVVKTIVKSNEYHDSIFLMGASKKMQELEGVEQAVIVMGTDTNKTLLGDLGLLTDEASMATTNDMVVAIEAANEDIIEGVIADLDKILQERPAEAGEMTYRTLEAALNAMPDANLALISVPGQFAAREARKALENNLHVLIFSDNVPIKDELELKKLAQEKGLLLMGADCGVAVINGVALALSSRVNPGPIGIVGASGSGIQEITVLVEREGMGISQAIGTGGRDLSDSIGAIGMLQGIQTLENDEKTSVIVLVSKPPAPKTMKKVLEAVAKCKNPVVVNFLGGDPALISEAGAVPAFTLEDAAIRAVDLARQQPLRNRWFASSEAEIKSIISNESAGFQSKQKYLRGLFCGGTFCEEAMLVLKDIVGDIYSNVPLREDFRLTDARVSQKHALVDMGTEEFTRGRPHPVIDPETRRRRLLKEASDPEVCALLLDFILGYGAHPDPAGALADSIALAKSNARQEGKYLSVVASVCGSKRDPQDVSAQERSLCEVGVVVMPSNAQASRLAGLIATRGSIDRSPRG